MAQQRFKENTKSDLPSRRTPLCKENPDILSSTCPRWAAQGPQWAAHSGQPTAHGGQPTAHGGQSTARGGQPIVGSQRSTVVSPWPTVGSPRPMVGGTLCAFPPGPGRPSTRISDGHPILACALCDKLYFTKANMSTYVFQHKSSNILLYVLRLCLLASPSCN